MWPSLTLSVEKASEGDGAVGVEGSSTVPGVPAKIAAGLRQMALPEGRQTKSSKYTDVTL